MADVWMDIDWGEDDPPGGASRPAPDYLAVAPAQVSARLRRQGRVLREGIARVQSEMVAAQLAGMALPPVDDTEPSVLAVLVGELERTERALLQLEQGSYGQCGVCGQPIAPERLRIVPAAARCDACARATTPQ